MHRHRRRSVPDGRAAQHRPGVPGEPRAHAASTGSSPASATSTIETTIKNTSTRRASVPVPRSDAARRSARRQHPGHRRTSSSSVPIGQLPLFGGEQRSVHARRRRLQRASSRSRTATRSAGGFPAFPGMVVDFVATPRQGRVVRPDDARLARQLRQRRTRRGYPVQDVTPYSMLLPFTYAGVTGAYMYEAAGACSRRARSTRTRRTSSSGAATSRACYDTILELRKAADRHVRRPRRRRADAGAGRARERDRARRDRIARSTRLETDERGAFLAHAAGRARTRTRSSRRSTAHRASRSFTIAAGEQTGVLVQMKPPATIAVVGRSTSSAATRRRRSSCSAHDAARQRRRRIRGRSSTRCSSASSVRPTAFDGTRPLHRGRVVDEGRPRSTRRCGPARTTSSSRAAPSTRSRRKTITRRGRAVRGRAARSSRARTTSAGLGRGRLPHPRAAVDRLRPADRRARDELRRRGPRGRGRDRSQLHHRLRAGDRGERASIRGCSASRAWS